jgi:acetamidase/formamidase
LVVEVLGMWPRLRHGSNCAAHWGRLYKDFAKERITIYELDCPAGLDGSGRVSFPPTATPIFGFDFTERELYDTPGVVSPPERNPRHPFSRRVAVPVRPHLGVIGVAPPGDQRLDSVPPGEFGGNVDNWRFGPGAVIRYPVFHEGAGFYVGDPHFSQGDGEVCGTAIEASLDVRLRLSVESGAAPGSPLLETGGIVFTHGFGADLDEAMLSAVREMVALMQSRFSLSADEAYSIASVAVDIGITQVVDGTVGCHASIDPAIFV